MRFHRDLRRSIALSKTSLYLILLLGHTISAVAGTVELSWDANTEDDLAGYQVAYGIAGGSLNSYVPAGLQTKISISGLQDGARYGFLVFAYDWAGNMSAPSDTVYATLNPSDLSTQRPEGLNHGLILEAEDALPEIGLGAITGPYYAFWNNGTISWQVDFPHNQVYALEIRAYSQNASPEEWPVLQLDVDGEKTAMIAITDTLPQSYFLSSEISGGSHRVSLSFTNDKYDQESGVDRNVFVDRIRILNYSTRTLAARYREGSRMPGFQLYQNYPNPFNPQTRIDFMLTAPALVRLHIYSMQGKRVRTVTNSHFQPGLHSVLWNARDDAGNAVATGRYMYVLTVLEDDDSDNGLDRSGRATGFLTYLK